MPRQTGRLALPAGMDANAEFPIYDSATPKSICSYCVLRTMSLCMSCASSDVEIVIIN